MIAYCAVNLSGSGLDGTVQCFTITSLPANGVFKDGAGNALSVGCLITATGNQAFVDFTPKANVSGETTFQYVAKDNAGLYDGSPATGKITIAGANDGPTAVNETATVTPGAPIWAGNGD